MDEKDRERLEKAEEFDQLEKINGNLEEIWHKLDLLVHFTQGLSENSVLGKEVDNALIMLARSHSKELDAEYKEIEDADGDKV